MESKTARLTVLIDPATGNRFAAADPRRDCYAIAY